MWPGNGLRIKNITFLDAEIMHLNQNGKKNTKFLGLENTCILGSYKKKFSKFPMRGIIVKIEKFFIVRNWYLTFQESP